MSSSSADVIEQVDVHQHRAVKPCINCMSPGTETFIHVTGDAQWQTTALVLLGIPAEEAEKIIADGFHQQVAEAAGGQPIVVTKDNVLIWPVVDAEWLTVRVCRKCAKRVGWTAGVKGRPQSHVVQPD